MDAYMYTCERIPLPGQAESLAPNHRYHDQKLCVDGAIVEKHARWAGGAVNKHPELGCCACGRWKTDVSSSVVNALKGIDEGAAPTNRSDAQPNSIVHTKALEGVADEVPCWSTKSPNVPWGNSPFCPAWPRYTHDNGSTLTAEQRALLRTAVRRAISPFAQKGISREKCAPTPSQPAHPLPSSTLLYPPLPSSTLLCRRRRRRRRSRRSRHRHGDLRCAPFAGRLEAALRPKCAQRLCLHVQILKGRLLVVAPQSVRC